MNARRLAASDSGQCARDREANSLMISDPALPNVTADTPVPSSLVQDLAMRLRWSSLNWLRNNPASQGYPERSGIRLVLNGRNGMARYQVILSYDGTDYFWISASKKRIDPSRVKWKQSLRRLAGMAVPSQRGTNRHRSACSGQVIAFDLDWRHDTGRPSSCSQRELTGGYLRERSEQKQMHFHPRYDASSREYAIRILIDPARDPLRWNGTAGGWMHPLNFDILHRSAAALPRKA